MPAKVLFSGECRGQYDTLLKRVKAVHSKNGPFDVLFCIGQFFGNTDNELSKVLDFAKALPIPAYFIGAYGNSSAPAIVAALQTAGAEGNLHYLGASGVAKVSSLCVAFLDGTHRANYYASGTRGGALACGCYSQADVSFLKDELQHLEGELDFLLTCEWPLHILDGVAAPPPGVQGGAGSSIVGDLADLARPRYHIAAGQPVFFARGPYINKDMGVGIRATRFVALAPVAVAASGEAPPPKFLHALGLVAGSDMDAASLAALPEGATPSPYEEARERARTAKRQKEEFQGQDWRWQTSKRQRHEREQRHAMAAAGGGAGGGAGLQGDANVVRDSRKSVFVRNLPYDAGHEDITSFFSQAGKVVDVRRGTADDGRATGHALVQFDRVDCVALACQLSGTQLMGRELQVEQAGRGETRNPSGPPPGAAVADCWFCLSADAADLSLVASVGDEVYLALDKGPITPNHVLLVPVEHMSSSLALSGPALAELERYLAALRGAARARGMVAVGFERFLRLRGRGGNHCHVNMILVEEGAAGRTEEAFRAACQASGVSLHHVAAVGGDAEGTRAALLDAVGDCEYIMAFLPDGSRLIAPLLGGVRLPMSLGREVLADLAGVPTRADWKAATAEPAEVQRNVEAFKRLFKPFDPMQPA